MKKNSHSILKIFLNNQSSGQNCFHNVSISLCLNISPQDYQKISELMLLEVLLSHKIRFQEFLKIFNEMGYDLKLKGEQFLKDETSYLQQQILNFWASKQSLLIVQVQIKTKYKQIIINTLALMSFLIDYPDKYLIPFKVSNNADKHLVQGGILENEQGLASLLDHLPKYFSVPYAQLVHVTSSLYSITIRYSIQNVYKNISALYNIRLNLKTSGIRLELKLLNSCNQYIQIEGNQRNKIIFKYLGRKVSQRDFKIEIDPTKGFITISCPYFFNNQERQSGKLTKIMDRVLKEFAKCLKQNSDLLANILQLSGQKHYEISSVYDQKEQTTKFLKNYEYRKITNIQLCFVSQAKENQSQLNEHLRKQIDSLQRIKNGFCPTQKQFRSATIFSHSLTDHSEIFQSTITNLSIDGTDRDYIRNKIELPGMQKDKNNEDNPYILNYVLINKLQPNIKAKQINRGGFTDIYLTEIFYWYIGSYWAGTFTDLTSIKSKAPVKKYVIIKRQNKQAKQFIKEGYRSRVAHQKYILKQIKNGFSIFLCKYYIDDTCAQLQNDLISDYIDFPNFQDYCIRHRESISIQTKIYLSLMITQSLRYLKDYKIVHLDLKPTNIMTNKRLTIKLIDFGESFHPDLIINSKSTHSPGFSMPYSAPQNWQEQANFTFKNDVFSLGVIMYQLFFGKLPFYFYSDTLKQKVYSQANYLDYLFFCPEQHAVAGELMAFPLIQAIILKCLHPDPGQRPQLQWIVYLLRQCLNYLY